MRKLKLKGAIDKLQEKIIKGREDNAKIRTGNNIVITLVVGLVIAFAVEVFSK